MNALRNSTLRQISRSTAFNSYRRFLSTKHLIINAVGSDRCGIVSDMAKYVTDAGGNVGESQAARLGKHFSLMMVVQVPEDNMDGFMTQLDAMTDLNASVFETTEDANDYSPPAIAYSGRFTVEGADNPGIVHKVTSVLSQSGLSIDKMETSDEIAPHGGTVLFKMVGLVHAYNPIDTAEVETKLDNLGDDLNCDISLEDL